MRAQKLLRKMEQHLKVESKVEPKAEAMDDEAVISRLKEILPTVNLEETTEKMLRGNLEAEAGRDLLHLKATIRKEVCGGGRLYATLRCVCMCLKARLWRCCSDRSVPGFASGGGGGSRRGGR